MNSTIKEELLRFSNRFLLYGKAILIAMAITAVSLTLYAGLRANYFTIQVLTVVISTLSVAVVGLFSYFAFKAHQVSARKPPAELNEELIRQLIRDVQELTPHQIEVISDRRQSHSVEGGLFRPTFLLAYRVAYAFCSALESLRFDFPEVKSEKKI
jgi:hypothetical protein